MKDDHEDCWCEYLSPLKLGLLAVLLGWTASSFAAPDPSGAGSGETASIPELRIRVDARVELVSLLFRLAGNPEYSHCRVPSYAADVENARLRVDEGVVGSARAIG